MAQLLPNVTVEQINEKIFLCNKNFNKWIELSVEAYEFLKSYLDNEICNSDSEKTFIDYLSKYKYISKDGELVNYGTERNFIQIVVEMGGDINSQKKAWETIKEKDKVSILKYSRYSNISEYLNIFSPYMLVVKDIDLDNFILSCQHILYNTITVIECENQSLEKIVQSVHELYKMGFESIHLFLNATQANYLLINTYVNVASEYLLGFNWNVRWCNDKVSLSLIFNILKEALCAYKDYNFDIYPHSPIFNLNSFNPCFKCNYPINKLVINKSGNIEFCQYLKARNFEGNIPECCRKDCNCTEPCVSCDIYTFCPYKNPIYCNYNCDSIRFLQKYILLIFDKEKSIEENIVSLHTFYEEFLKEKNNA